MQFLAVRCLNCQNFDSYPRFDIDQVPFCSQCSSTSDLVPEPQPKAPTMVDNDSELSALFSRNLCLNQAPPTPPTLSPQTANFSITQHYHHSSHHHSPPSPQSDDSAAAAQLFFEHQQSQAQIQKSRDREYAEYLMSSDLSSPNSRGELEIALAHGIISNQEYQSTINKSVPKALEENCSAMEMLDAAAKRHQELNVDPVFRTSEWFNDYYGGVDSSFEMDEENPCSIYTGGGCRLRPFDL